MARVPAKTTRPFDARAFLESAGLGQRVVTYGRGDIIFSQGDPCDSVMYIRNGAVQLAVLSHAGREAIVGTLNAGDFMGERAPAKPDPDQPDLPMHDKAA